jgi:hypothetical protein
MTAFAATESKHGAFAEMEKVAIDIAKALARLSELTIFELRGEWRRLHRMPPPIRRAAARPNRRRRSSWGPGTRLVREWRAVTHMVLIHADGIEWRGERYPSLSVIARKITGARWSGPRFFGLRRRQLPG